MIKKKRPFFMFTIHKITAVRRGWCQTRWLRSQLQDLPASRQRSIAAGHHRTQAIRPSGLRPGSIEGRPARRKIATCTDTTELLRYALNYMHDTDTLCCVIQRLGELPLSTRSDRNSISKAVHACLSAHSQSHLPNDAFASIAFATLKRTNSTASSGSALWSTLSDRQKKEPIIVSAALSCAVVINLDWGKQIVIEAGNVVEHNAVRGSLALFYAKSGLWKDLWKISIPHSAIAGLTQIAVAQNRPEEGWEVWRIALNSEMTPVLADLTSLIPLVVLHGGVTEIRWCDSLCNTYESKMEVDSWYLFHRSALFAALYCKTGEVNNILSSLEVLKQALALEGHRGLQRWERDKAQRLHEVVSCILQATETTPPTADHLTLLQQAIRAKVVKEKDTMVKEVHAKRVLPAILASLADIFGAQKKEH